MVSGKYKNIDYCMKHHAIFHPVPAKKSHTFHFQRYLVEMYPSLYKMVFSHQGYKMYLSVALPAGRSKADKGCLFSQRSR